MIPTNSVLPSEGEKIELRIESIAYGGDGIGRKNGFTFFVPRTAPGDEILAEVINVRKRYARARLLELRMPSADRRHPKCDYFQDCGGCQYQHIHPDVVAKIKEQHVIDAIHRLGKIEIPEIKRFYHPQSEYAYRSRLTYRRAPAGEQGYVRLDRKGVVDIGNCDVALPQLDEIWQALRPKLKSLPSDLVPYVFLRGTNVDQFAVVFSITARNFDRDSLIEISRDLPHHPSIFASEIQQNSKANFGKEVYCLSGSPHLEEELDGIRFVLDPDLFFQVHFQTRHALLETAKDWANGIDDPIILDLFCGSGFFSLPLAKQGKDVFGIDSDYRAIQAAIRSSETNNLMDRARFRAGKADRILRRVRQRESKRFSSAIVDPPRGGLGEPVIHELVNIGVRDILYISCSPPTMARDLKDFSGFGFELEWVKPLDMFPQTYHIEMAAHIRRI